MLNGITIQLVNKHQSGIDGFNVPIYVDEFENIEDVLVAPSSSSDITDALSMYGRKAIYSLAIPKEDVHDWENREVIFFGKRWKTIGIPLEGIEENIPLRWNKKVMVGTYE